MATDRLTAQRVGRSSTRRALSGSHVRSPRKPHSHIERNGFQPLQQYHGSASRQHPLASSVTFVVTPLLVLRACSLLNAGPSAITSAFYANANRQCTLVRLQLLWFLAARSSTTLASASAASCSFLTVA